MKKLTAKRIFDPKQAIEVEFLFGAHNFSQIPKNHFPEIAFLGASNVGKSSLINALLGKKVTIVSSTPGRTQQLNFFKIYGYKDGFILVDMPGYGFARARNKDIEHWQKTSFQYLTNRVNLRRVFLLIDPIKGLKNLDHDVIDIFNTLAVSFQIVLTKSDKLSRNELKKVEEEILKEMKKWPAVYHQILTTSSTKGYGIFELQDEIIKILNPTTSIK